MRAWLTEEVDCLSDVELWGEAKDNYTMKDLEAWLTEKDGKKTKVVSNAKAKDIVKGKGKEKAKTKVNAGKEKVQGSTKEKEGQEKPKVTKTQHKKKTHGVGTYSLCKILYY